ncbi:type IVB secretion system protein IcmH/DotU [Chelativorans salis]|uniref:Type IVB secretion system protein IcmH/DotU n=1 Tax=Chelativorans salis TaxID=2978478 RepID=A0ABT2LJZ5_9HYPH|nr:type IVB secretion system protein IcmH/DotU [Chelativorans sp. EGI FJ00035]MCT7374157.1 type IVB secretion system protein IcmH/DotU [Chelativorans sp. EGI FJ00035]
MTSNDDPQGEDGKTIIRPSRRNQPDRASRTPDDGTLSQHGGSGATVFDPGLAQRPPAGWQTGTVIFQGPPSADSLSSPAPDAVLAVPDGFAYTSANPFIAAAAPVLVILGRLQLASSTNADQAALAERIARAIQDFEHRISDAGLSDEDIRMAKFALCETADDVIAHLPDTDPKGWKEHAMLPRFFHLTAFGTGFFQALNKVLADPDRHCDLIQFMHACMSLGFEGQYRGSVRKDHGIDRVRRDVYETLRYFRPRTEEDISPRWKGLAEEAPDTASRTPLWSVAAGLAVLLVGGYVVLRVLIAGDGEAVVQKLLALNPDTPVTIERASVSRQP